MFFYFSNKLVPSLSCPDSNNFYSLTKYLVYSNVIVVLNIEKGGTRGL